MQISEELKTALFAALDSYGFERPHQSNHYFASDKNTNILMYSLVIEPVGNNDKERIKNAQIMRQFFFAENGFGISEKIYGNRFQIKEKKNDQLKVKVTQKGESVSCFLLDTTAELGTLVVYSGIINSVFKNYTKYLNGLKNEENSHNEGETSLPEVQKITDAGLDFYFAQGPLELAAPAPQVPREDEIMEDPDLTSIRDQIKAMKAQKLDVAKDCDLLRARVTKLEDLKAEFAREQRELKAAQEERQKLKDGYKTQASNFTAAMRSSPAHVGQQRAKAPAETPAAAPAAANSI